MPVLPQSFDLNSPAWLISLRWVAICLISGTILGAQILFHVEVNWAWLAPLLLGLGIWNFSLPWLEELYSLSVKAYVFVQILVDLCVLTTVLWITGGLVNPFASFYLLHVMIAGLLLDRRLTIAVAFLAILLLNLLMLADPLLVAGKPLDLRGTPLWIGLLVSLVLLIIIATAFILGFMHRLERSQEESRQREKMAAMGRLVAGLAHELGTPLNVIVLLAQDLADGAGEEAKRDLETIVSQARRCGDLVALLLGYSRSTQNSQSQGALSLHSWLEDIFNSARKSLDDPKKYNEAQFLIRNNLGLEKVDIAELPLRQILWNLLKNALQACGDELYPVVEVEVNPIRDSSEVQFLVRDNGPGFNAESRDRAFEAFYSTKKPGEGDGLGLYMSYHLMEQLSGKIAIPKELQTGGAVVELLVPLQKE